MTFDNIHRVICKIAKDIWHKPYCRDEYVDLVQQGHVAWLEAAPKYNPAEGAQVTYLWTTVKRALVRWARGTRSPWRERVAAPLEDGTPWEEHTASTAAQERDPIAEKRVYQSTQPFLERELGALWGFMSEDFPSLARSCGTSKQTVYNNLHTALVKLRKEVA